MYSIVTSFLFINFMLTVLLGKNVRPLSAAHASNLLFSHYNALVATLWFLVVMYFARSSAKSDPSTPFPNIPLIVTRKKVTLCTLSCGIPILFVIQFTQLQSHQWLEGTAYGVLICKLFLILYFLKHLFLLVTSFSPLHNYFSVVSLCCPGYYISFGFCMLHFCKLVLVHFLTSNVCGLV